MFYALPDWRINILLTSYSKPHLDKYSAVEGVHDCERQVIVENTGDDLQRCVSGVFGVADVGRYNPTTFIDEMMPADNGHNPQRRH